MNDADFKLIEHRLKCTAAAELTVALDQIARLVGVMRSAERGGRAARRHWNDDWDEVLEEAEDYLEDPQVRASAFHVEQQTGEAK